MGWKLYNNKCYEKCPLGSITCTTDATTCEPCAALCSTELNLLDTPIYFQSDSSFMVNELSSYPFNKFPFPLWKVQIMARFKINSCSVPSTVFRMSYNNDE